MAWIAIIAAVSAALAGAGLAYVLGAAAVGAFWLNGMERFLVALPQQFFTQVDSFTFLAMPLFILAGEVMTRGGVTRALVDLALLVAGRLPGGLGHVDIAASVFLAGISGSGVADAAALAKTFVPEMERRGYSRAYAGALTAAASVIGPIIPPSIILVFYGAMMSVSVPALFAAGFVPGILLAGALMATNAFVAWRRGYPASPPPPARLPVVLKAAPSLALPVVILGGIVFGWVTPTEAAALAVAAALIVSFLYTWLELRSFAVAARVEIARCGKGLLQTALISGAIFAIIFAAGAFEYLLALMGLPKLFAQMVESLGLGLYGYLAFLTAALLVAGTVMEAPMALVLLVPVLVPPAIALGANPIHLGTIICFNLSLGLISPPVGGSLMAVSAIAKIPFGRLSLAILPFFLVEVAVLGALVIWPDLVLVGPRLAHLVS